LKGALVGKVVGTLLAAEDPGYAEEIAAFNRLIVHQPPVVVAVRSAADVVESVRVARARGLPVSVQGTGHGAHRPVTSGLLLSTRRLDRVEVDPAARTARIGAGVPWGAVIAAAAPHGLAPITGSSPGVGAVGYLLGGGLGPLARSHGFSSDYLLALTVVTGAGEPVEATATHHPELFWALRGGKTGLGIVTEARLRLVELPSLYAGSLFFEESHCEQALRTWVDWTATADAGVTTSIAIIRFPALEVVPPPLRGRTLLNLRFAYPGAIDAGEALAAPLRAAAPIYLDALGPLALADVARIHNDPTDPAPAWVHGFLLSHIDQAWASATLAQVGAGRDTPFIAVEVRHLGGATHIDVPEGSAVGGRPAGFTVGLVSRAVPLFQTVVPAAADRLVGAMRPWLSPETNINFTPEPRSSPPLALPWSAATLARLQEARRRYDPDGILAASYGG
jgi:FAD/FMN-containing dehydrogenase